jgi:hydrogenase/urease accessory protein HupE
MEYVAVWSWKLLWAPLLILSLLDSATAHDGRPLYIDIREIEPHLYTLQWKIPPSVPLFNTPGMERPSGCQEQGTSAESIASDGLLRRAVFRCPAGLAGQLVTIAYPGPNPFIASLIRYSALSGEQHVSVLGPQETTWTVPHAETRWQVARQYTVLGLEHIWAGVDHLLFVACLMWIAGTWRRILLAITGFTLAHSATLVLSALQVIRLPIPPVEATIALSVVFLALEIAKGPRQNLCWHAPIVVSGMFGLLHGLGFAAALDEIGLPQTQLMTGLLFFNVGVEIGQVLFAAAMIGFVRLAKRLSPKVPATVHDTATWAGKAIGYSVGTFAMFLFIQRIATF